MTSAALPNENMGPSCPRCGEWNAERATSCRGCLAPLNDRGLAAGLPGSRRMPGRLAGGMLACALAAFALVVPGSPLSLLRRPEAAPTYRQIAVPVERHPDLGKYEPEAGCFLGAFVVRDINISGSMKKWEQLTGKGHASYLNYVGYGKPFPKA
ncbi:MAG TPA: hypothetical protein VFU47_09515, partial [Armatimonadota bacterium]|nr:hypothetical protein [Armatimonadota bacterium]